MLNTLKITRSHIAEVNWKSVSVFYLLACALSYGLHFLPNLNKGILPVHNVFTYGMGPLLAAVSCRFLFPQAPRTISVFGSAPLKTILFVLTPILLSVVLGVPSKAGQNSHVFGLLLGISGVLYGFGEEMGWRGYLQDALRPLPTLYRAILIGVMHAGWHLTFMPDLSGISGGQTNALMVVGVLILMAWGLGALVDTTKAVLVVACAHELMNIAVHPVALAVTLLVWIGLVRNWSKQLPRFKNFLFTFVS
ncbi:CPBP family intramembrane glutamic endopeptidase [Spirosoma aerolatum]|uniref:CPBP family intramembrane glutamic endopeptidase n=1 Tax=Spirosoma aerolatum TaxID=1211326 RepID=UPI0009AE11BC|nr:CPBP family intramembrane glutamic endopeptidase [Spirosoma aerolatum]